MYQRLTTIQYDFIQDLWSRNNIVGCGRRLLVRCLFVDYANKPDRRIRSWHRAHVQIKADNLDLDNIYLLRGLGVEVLDAVEMSRQEAARNILRLAMYEASRKVSFIPTVEKRTSHRAHGEAHPSTSSLLQMHCSNPR
ncbi:hypothetical protein HPB51_007382 [Rhipicephalus microplus]|uniref:Uncharacterized protein n=1 Tax=Rhipicephalus microplus TaxID=6941 RepID=A0A9J6EZS7_RHIMP|nr:hypothetical protein HPB51_007382 [Rhipicephalus microplus]